MNKENDIINRTLTIQASEQHVKLSSELLAACEEYKSLHCEELVKSAKNQKHFHSEIHNSPTYSYDPVH